jgi:carbamoyl-phosphate synthase large subunit
MKSTGEVMGIGPSFGVASPRPSSRPGTVLPRGGTRSSACARRTATAPVAAARRLHELGFRIIGRPGTPQRSPRPGSGRAVNKVSEGSPHVVDALEAGSIALVINTPRPTHRSSRLVLDSADRARAQDPVLHDDRRRGAAAEAIAAMAAGRSA